MINDFLYSGKVPFLNKALDAYALRQQTFAKNIANADTPNYRPERVKFEELFHREEVVLKGVETKTGHIEIGNLQKGAPSGEKDVQDIPDAEIFFSGENHVNLDKEMSKSAENQIRFRMASKMVNKYFTGLSSAIKGRNA